MVAGELLGLAETAAADGDDLGLLGQQGEIAGQDGGDVTGAENAPADTGVVGAHHLSQPHATPPVRMTLMSFTRTMAAMVAASNPDHAATSGVGEPRSVTPRSWRSSASGGSSPEPRSRRSGTSSRCRPPGTTRC